MLDVVGSDFLVDKKIFLKNVNLKLGAGEIIHLLGNNGAGKSTLLEGLLNLTKNHTGSILRNFSSDEYGYLPQVAHQFPKIHLKLQDICEEEFFFYTRDLFEKKWHLSSGGERKKALIGKAIFEAKKLLILDEPFNHLDKKACSDVAREIERVSNNGVAVIYTGHEYELNKSRKIEVSQWRS